MNRGQETMERLIDLQRNMAEMTLSALEWGESAQRQGIEMTQSMLESAPGPRFTESMMERYLEGMEAIVPEMEQAMEQGMRTAARPGTAAREQRMGNAPPRSSGQRGTAEQRPMGREAGQSAMGGREGSGQQPMGGRQQTGDQQPMEGQQRSGQQPMGEQRQSSQSPMGGQQPTSQQSMGGRGSSPSGQGPSARQSTGNRRQQMGGGRSRSQGFQRRPGSGERYRQTGEWVTPQEYGGESPGTTEYQQRPLSAAPNPSPEYEGQSRRGETGPRGESEREPSASEFEREQQGREQPRGAGRRSAAESRQGHGQPGGSMGGRGRSAPDRERRRPTEGGQSEPGRTEQGRFRDQYTQRIDPDRSGVDRVDAGRSEGDDRDRSPERRATEEPDVTSEPSEQPTDEPTEEE